MTTKRHNIEVERVLHVLRTASLAILDEADTLAQHAGRGLNYIDRLPGGLAGALHSIGFDVSLRWPSLPYTPRLPCLAMSSFS